ncbi:MAG TPA: PKD domain-containing protein, partial [Flavobacteriales bacterium]|nr:PKD domain-containing protein [Flavobacteriales bacterium]
MLRCLAIAIFFLFSIPESFAQPLNANAGPNKNICSGASTTLGATPAATGGTGSYTYSWSPATGLSCTNCPNPVCTATTSTTYTLTVDDGNNTDNDNVNVNVTQGATASFTFSPNNSCSSIPVVFANTSTPLAGSSFQWNFGDPASGSANTSTQMNPTHTFVAPGNGTQTFTVSLTVTSSTGCTHTTTQNVTVNQSPAPELIDPFTSFRNCDGSIFNMEVFDNTNPTTNNSYVINWGDGTPDFVAGPGPFPSGSVTHIYSTMGIYTLTYTVTGTNGCANTFTQFVSNITNPAIGVSNPGNTNGCGPITLCFPLSSFAGNHSSTTYRVNYGDGSPEDIFTHPPPATVCHTYTQSSCSSAGGAYTFSITARNSCDSSTATVTPIRVYTAPQANFTESPNPACVNSAVTFINSSVAGFNASCSQSTVHVWQWGDGTPNTTVFTNAPQTHTYTAPGNYTVVLSTSNGCGTTTMTRTVCIEAPPVPNFTLSPTSGCVPLISNITNLSDTSLSCDVNWNWVVTFNGSPCVPASGAFSFTNGTNANSWQPQITFNSQGTYTVTLQLINSCGTFPISQTVTVHKVPEITFPALPNICAGQSITPTATFLDCTAPITTYNWIFPGGVPATSNLQIPGSVSFAAAGNPTITVSATNICGTTNATQSVTITAAPPAPVAGSNSPLCEGATLDLTASNIANANYQWSGPNGFTATTQNPSITNVTVANAGSYSVFATVNGCAGPSASTNVVINPAPVVTIVPVNPSICAGQSVLLTGSGASSYVWNDGTGNVGTNATLNVSPAATTTYTLTGTTAGCSAQVTTTVTVNPVPIVNAGPDLTLCNQPIGEQLNGTPAGGTWSGTGITPGGLFTPSTVGVFVMTYSFTDGNGCTSTDNASITVNDPVPVVMGSNQSVCLNAAHINVTANPAGGVWLGTGVSAAGIFTPSAIGTFTLTYTLGTGTCATSGTLDVTVNPLPVINPGAPINVCFDAAVQNLNATPPGGTWSGSGVSGLTFDPALAGVGVHNLTYSFTDGNGCSNTGNLSTTVNALPIVNAGADQIVCDQPIPVVLSGTPAGGTWTGPNVTAGGSFTPNGTGVFALTYSFTDGNGCSSNDQMNVTVVAPTPADAGLPQSVCHNAAAITLNGIPAGGTWSGTNITAGGIFTPSTVGVFTLTYSFGTGTCATTDDVQVTVNALPIVNAGVDFQLCVDAAPLNLNGIPAGGTWSGTGITNPSGVFSASVSGVGAHVLTYSFTDGNGCTNTDQLDATINALPVVNAGADTTVCDLPIPVTLTGTPVGGTWSGANITAGGVFTPNGTGAFTVTYTFTLGTGCTASDDRVVNVIAPQQANAGPDQEICHNAAAITINGLPAGGTWSGSFVTAGGLFTPSTPGTYNLTYTFGVGNCQTTDVMQIIVHPLPVVNAGVDQNICIDAAVTILTGTPVGGSWSGIGITNAALGTFDPFVAGVGAHNITYTFTHPVTGCLNSDVMVMNVQPLPVMGFSNNPIACVGIAEPFTNTTTGAISYAWNFGDGNTSTQTNPQNAYAAVGTYTISLTATSLFGCVNSITGSIDVFEPPVANFTLAPDSACGPLVVNFNNISSGQSISYNWDFGNGTTSALAAPGAVTYPAGYLADTTYTIVLSVSNFCATVTHTEQVIVMPEPKAIFGTNVNVGCSPFTPEIANNSVGLPDTYFWNFGDGTTGNQADALFGHTFFTGLEDTTFT